MALLDELLREVESSETPKEKKLALEKRLVAERLRAAVMIRDITAPLDRLGGTENMDPWNLSEGMYRLGFAHATLYNLSLRLRPDYQAMIHARRTSATIVETRYTEDRNDYEPAIQESEEYWKNGGTDLHPVIAQRLAKKFRVIL
ncbi:MAG: hypothetical protein AB2L11_04600 [Syntrophobacteraceae bacterium]